VVKGLGGGEAVLPRRINKLNNCTQVIANLTGSYLLSDVAGN